ncbi:DUF3500 domain-containing protein [Streptomyces sp. NPDC048002]|uniref:DUF3500 domain-containing protein n=1 Tax=Streptomyces sp. NPDC048002 TaxID=3154344 RepID=UPI0033F75A19
MAAHFRDHLYPLDHPRLARFRDCDPCSYVTELRNDPLFDGVLTQWQHTFETTRFAGISSDGVPRTDVFPYTPPEPADAAPAATAGEAALALLACLDEDARTTLSHPLDSRVWRAWMNPEIYLNRFGLRLEEVDEEVRARALALLAASLSPTGYQEIRDVMAVNAFLGDLTQLPRLMNEFSYNINIFGTPSPTEPWGWNLWGHHLALNCLFIGSRQVLAPVFLGAEPNRIDAGSRAGLRLFADRENAGLALARSLTREQAEQAVLYQHKRDPAMPADRLHPGDELHLGGAFQDNRVIPYEGIAGKDLIAGQRETLVELVARFLGHLPEAARRSRISEVRAHLDETRFCWIGGTGDDDPFYFRVQSPVVLIEYDHHAGMFLTNEEPQKFHTHTLVRIPNGNDYGVELVRRATGTPHLLDGPL